jgi:phenylalanyl-tRNA synthetase beta chain
MKFTLSWLKEHLETEATLAEIVETLTDTGLEVERVEDPAESLGAFTIARVIECGRHPDADRLSLCRVEAWPEGPGGPREEVQVVCGAPNARTGMVGVFAPPGTHIPGTGVDLKRGVIRGVESNGMLCSERELMLSDDHEGIIDLPADAPLGARYIDYAGLDDPVVEIAITPNRPDALGVAGIARDLAARGLGRIVTPAVEPVPGAFPSPVTVTLGDDVADEACPLFALRMIRGVENGPSPDWLQRRLRAIGLRPISALVDITNFLTFDRARPLHVFDADRIKGDLHVRLSRAGEELEALDDRTYVFDDAMTVICDETGPEGIGGVMGGAISGCDGSTENVLLEAAYFDPVRTAATGRKLKITSDARYRFERGVDPAFTIPGMELATRMILDLCGGDASEPVIAGRVPDTARAYPLHPARVSSLVGMDIPREEQVRILTALGFSAAGLGETLEVWVPSWRPDIGGEADLVEEIARIASLSKLPAKPLKRPGEGVAPTVLTSGQRRRQLARRRLAAAGLDECVTYSFVAGPEAALFGGGDADRKLENPISSEMSDMRPSLLPGLLAAAHRNQARGFEDLGLFEVGAAFMGPEPGEQETHATAIRVGHTAPRHWSGVRRAVDLWDAKADAEAALAALGAPVAKLQTAREAPGWFHPGRSAVLKLGPKTVLAAFGELHPRVLGPMEVKGPAVAAVVRLDAVPEPKRKTTARPALVTSDYQAVERDFAFVVDSRAEVAEILRAARGADKALIAEARVFDVFEGPRAEAQLGEGKKSVAIAVRLEPADRTLTDAEIDAVAGRIVAAVEKATGGQLRG